MERVIAYIDGFNLFFGLKSRGWKRYYWLDVPALVQNLLRPNQHLVATKYFTSRVSSSLHDPGKPKRQNTYLEALQTRPDLSVFFGHYLQQPITCVHCGTTWHKFAEKMTDVNIATELLSDAFQDQFDMAMLVSGDSDLTAPIRAVRRFFASKRVVAAFPPNRYSVELARAASTSIHIGRAVIAASQMPNQVAKPDGFVLHRPTKWN